MAGSLHLPRLIKGALIAADPDNPVASAVVFQYNPDTMTRRLEPRAAGGEGEQGEAFRLTGPPKETITVAVEIDATDQLEEGRPLALVSGINPTLAALEMMLYPKSKQVIANSLMAALGTIEILPVTGPMILFVWGPTRVLPVRVTGMSITEEAYDTRLNPTRAKVELSLTVLSYSDLKMASLGHGLFMAHQIAKEVMATSNPFNNTQSIGTPLGL